MTFWWVPNAALGVMLGAASICDLRSRTVPLWLSFSGIVSGLAVAMVHGPGALQQSAVGLGFGLLLSVIPVLKGGLGIADALVLASVGAWEGWWVTLRTAWWGALAGVVLLVVAWRLGRRSFAYVPAIAVGFAVAVLV